MSYYAAGDYYRAGDYRRAGGLLSFIGGAARGFLTGGPVGAVTGAIGAARGTSRSPLQTPGVAPRLTSGPRPGYRDEPGISGTIHRLMPGGKSGYQKIGRTMRYTNPKALKRAERRLRGFEKMAKRALRPLGLHVVRHTCQHSSHKRGGR